MVPPVKRSTELEQAIDNILESYSGPEDINNLESAALPNKRSVIEALGHLKAAIYIGFFSNRALDRGNLRYSISEHIYPAHALLTEQIARAITYEDSIRRRHDPRPEGWGEEVVLRLLKRLPSLRRTLNGDALAAYENDPAANSLEEVIFSYPAVEAISSHRIAHILFEEAVPMIPRIISEHAHGRTGIDIHPGARIGDRFFIDHGTGVVVGETTDIGSNVKLYQGVTLGALSVRRGCGEGCQKRHPTIEDDCTIYAGATILGGETVIGAGSVIGGNVWLTKSVPPGSKVFYRPRE